VNGIAPGWVDTPGERRMQHEILGMPQGWLDERSAQQPFGRLLDADDIARLATFLASDISSPMTGAIVDQEQSVHGVRD
jgi:NAD(P)-dependent dehydrogenase (short-subunit alcohol dehydrogenase family)